MLHRALPIYCATLVVIGWVRSCVSVRSVARKHFLPSLRGGRVVWRACCQWRRRSRSPCCALVPGPAVVHFAVAVFHRCRATVDSDCDTVLQLLCTEWLRSTLLLAVLGVCNAAPPLCVTTVPTGMLDVQWGGVCSCGAVGCLCVSCSSISVSGSVLVVSVRCCVALLCCCVWHCASLDGRCGCQQQ
jgi:hypothetical protein